MRLVASVLMLLLLQVAPSKPKPVEYKETRLPNGLTVITHEDHSTPVINAQIWYHVGSKDEKPGKTGFCASFRAFDVQRLRTHQARRARQDHHECRRRQQCLHAG